MSRGVSLAVFAGIVLLAGCEPAETFVICGMEPSGAALSEDCIPPEAPIMPEPPEPEASEALSGSAGEYAPLPISSLGIDGTESPQDIADMLKAMLGANQPVEGNYSEVAEVIQDGANVRVRFRVEGIPDDSVKATEHVVDIFLPAAVAAGVTGYGWRQKCWRAEDPDAWTIEPCP